jgi:hypothetical protein
VQTHTASALTIICCTALARSLTPPTERRAFAEEHLHS